MQVLKELEQETRTIILYEAPHHLKKTLEELKEHLGNRPMTICRELTKKHEEKLQMTIEEALLYYEETDPRGEYVLVLAKGTAAGMGSVNPGRTYGNLRESRGGKEGSNEAGGKGQGNHQERHLPSPAGIIRKKKGSYYI